MEDSVHTWKILRNYIRYIIQISIERFQTLETLLASFYINLILRIKINFSAEENRTLPWKFTETFMFPGGNSGNMG